jgi:N-acetylglucosamine-6-sulfatase
MLLYLQRAASLVVIFAGLSMPLALPAEAAQTACAQIRAACESAGFVKGGIKEGNGLQVDCIDPITQGSRQPRKASKPLPQVDPKIVAACKATRSAASGTGAQNAAPDLGPSAAATGASISAVAHGPNIVFILVDDLSRNLLAPIAGVQTPNLDAMRADGTVFANYFVTDSLCCPSRSSIFTGKLPHNTQVFTNTPPLGGYGAFMAHQNDAHTFAVALQNAGYKTAMLGKYLNGYMPVKDGVPQGWSEWDVDGAKGYGEFDYILNQNGTPRHYGKSEQDYLTDVVSRLGRAFIEKSSPTPFFIEIATFAPHAPYVPAPRDADKFSGLGYDHSGPQFGAPPDANAPLWLKKIPPLRQTDINAIDKAFRMRVQSVQAIDKMIGDIRALLVRLGIDKNTYVIFSSDNGYHMGEYSLRPGKMSAFDTDIHVPLIILGPGVPRGQVVQQIVENIDLCPTITDLAGVASAPTAPDGHSLVSLLHPLPSGAMVTEWRHEALIEHRHPGADPSDPDLPEPNSGNPPSYEALRMQDALYVEYDYAKHEVEYYDLKNDPLELKNTANALSPEKRQRLHDVLRANAICQGTSACWVAQHMLP